MLFAKIGKSLKTKDKSLKFFFAGNLFKGGCHNMTHLQQWRHIKRQVQYSIIFF